MKRLALIAKLQESDEDEVAVLGADGQGYEITDVQDHRGILCITEGDDIVFPEDKFDDEDDLDDDS